MQTVVVSDRASYGDSEKVTITATVTDLSGPVEGAAVHVELTTANGNKLQGGGTTEADGVACLTYEIDTKQGGAGTYDVEATASKDGFERATDSTTFEVTD